MKTSYYSAAAKLDKASHFLVRTSLGSPRFLKCDAAFPEITPDREMLGLEERDYQKAYFKKLDKSGVAVIKKRLSELQKTAGKKTLVLLCFESLSDENLCEGQFCHRTMFAKWFKKKTGIQIEEHCHHSEKKAKTARQIGLL